MQIKLMTSLSTLAVILVLGAGNHLWADDNQAAKAEEEARQAAKQQISQAIGELKQQLQQMQKQQEGIQAQEKALAEQKAQFEEQRKVFEKHHAEMEQQKARIEAEAMRYRDAQRGGVGGDVDVMGLRAKAAQAAQADQAARAAQMFLEQQIKAVPLPDNAAIKVFKLQYVRPDDIGQALQKITGGGGPRVAVDERTDALLIAGTDKQISVAEQLVKTLDQPGKAQGNTGPETLQVRIVWLLDKVGESSPEPKATIVTPQVLEALHELGFERPSVACQQLSTITLGTPGRGGDFHFQVPTLVHGYPWQFEGQGEISLATDNRYAMKFGIDIVQPNNPQRCQVGGSIVTPLDHYTVLGTTTFVGPVGDGKEGEQSEHLSAFVVYVDRAKGFAGDGSAEKSEQKDKPQVKR